MLRLLRAASLLAVAFTTLAAAAARADDPAPGYPGYTGYPGEYGFQLSITDHIALPGQDQPDSISGWWFVTPGAPPSAYQGFPRPRVIRNGAVVAQAGPYSSFLRLADLRDGDVVQLVDATKPGEQVLTSFTYRKRPTLDAPNCPSAPTYVGTRDGRGTLALLAQAVHWTPGGPGPTIDPNYPQWPILPPAGYYPGYYPGSTAPGTTWAYASLVGADRFVLTPDRPLAAGSHVYIQESLAPTNGLRVTLETDSLIGSGADCSSMATPTPTPEPTQLPQSGTILPTPSPTPVPTPAGDRTAPTGAISGLTTKILRKLGRTKVVRVGLPVSITSSEPGRLIGTLTLVGKKPFSVPFSVTVIKGTRITHVLIPNALRKKLRTLKHPRIRMEAALVDAADNRQPLPTIAVSLPEK